HAVGKKQKVLFWASAASRMLVIIKAGAYMATGSLLVLGSLFDSAGDALVSAVNGKVHKLALAKPDREHPYGHGGFEVVTALAQGVILSVLGLVLFINSLNRLFLADSAFLHEANIGTGMAVLRFAAFTGL